MERFGRFQFSVQTVPLAKGFALYFGTLRDKGAVPVPVPVLEKLAWPPLQSLAVKKNFFVVQILGSEKLLKFVEKCR